MTLARGAAALTAAALGLAAGYGPVPVAAAAWTSAPAGCADPVHAQVAHDLAHHTRQLRVLADQVAALDPAGPHTSHRAGVGRGSTVDGGAAGYPVKGLRL